MTGGSQMDKKLVYVLIALVSLDIILTIVGWCI